jgi:hypothetical protein
VCSSKVTACRTGCPGEIYYCAVLALQAVEGKPESIGNAELVINLAQVVLDDLLSGTELMGDLLVAHA